MWQYLPVHMLRGANPNSWCFPHQQRHTAVEKTVLDKWPWLSPTCKLPISTSSIKTMPLETKAVIASFGGQLLKLAHHASTTNCQMGFNLYLPPSATQNPLHKIPLLIYLAGLTCTGDNGAEKGFFQHAASQKGIAVLYPDTSPRTIPSEARVGEEKRS